VALVLGLTVAGFVLARALADREARRDSDRRAEVAAAQVRGRLAQAASLTESLRRFMVDAGGTGVTSDRFARNASRWLSPADFQAAAWVERIPDTRRAAYERRIGQHLVTPDFQRAIVPLRSRSWYLPTTVVSGFPPLDLQGIDLSGKPGMAAALARAARLGGVAATPLAPSATGTSGLYLVAPARNLIGDDLHAGYVVVFVSDSALHAAADAPRVQITSVDGSTQGGGDANTSRRTFALAGQRFGVAVPREPVEGVAAALPWIILAAGVVLAGLAAALGVNRARRARAQEELDRIFTLSPDLIAVADFDGYFRRVNPAAERILGYTEQELLARPYLDFVHPDDRDSSQAEAAALAGGKARLGFENRYVRKDGSYRVLEWTASPAPDEGLMYCVARDVTERRRAEAEVERLADEQAALRRVATLVAREASQSEVFTAIAQEIGGLLGMEAIWMLRYADDDSVVVVGSSGGNDVFALGSRQALEGDSVAVRVLRTARTARLDDYGVATGQIADTARSIGVRSAVGAPILVEGRLWGAIVTGSTRPGPLPPETESRLGQFTALMATTIANAESHARANRLADEQAALRRVATLAAEGQAPSVVFDAVAAEAAALLDADDVVLSRYEQDDEASVVAHCAADAPRIAPGTRIDLEPHGVAATVRRTRRPAWIERPGDAAVGAPIMVEGRLWGVIRASWRREPPPAADTEQRMAQFAELLETAIANADSHDQLTASRARLLTEADDARRRVVRDLHDGAQQRLVHTIVTLKLAQRALERDNGEAESLVGEALQHAQQGQVELRELAHGILPTALTRGGLRAGLGTLVSRLDLPVAVDVPDERFPAEIEASAYFIVAEALTNVVKHSHAQRAAVTASVEDGMLQVEIRDDGIGGANPHGHGLVGMRDRVTALSGRLRMESPAGAGTHVVATLPLSAG
jgi:PAS domain S-box-containing protein